MNPDRTAEEQESGEDESEEDSENESESSGPEGTPGNSEDRPSFVNRMLSGLFGKISFPSFYLFFKTHR
ncbi:hypothetical protein HRED_07731 [Candidatus Haloredivivus sp. G17]|nr:hypothetical protein HRED_07731 [Candidatus Haloredivivus sp. G17]